MSAAPPGRAGAPVTGERAPLGALVRLFLRLGFSGFGGPLVHIALMETEVVGATRSKPS